MNDVFRVKLRIKKAVVNFRRRDKEPVDYEDDWMSPKPSSFSYVLEKPKDEIQYLIERKKKTICFGNPGYITTWEFWDKFDTAKARDEELNRLESTHPMWQLRARDSNPAHERLIARY